ncbi:MAG TPA: hypothetical protein VN643_19985 [Pyrinomonadaceae bacterium]|nr:hypothetical protein [Pyrinomonadaceae bacterium]
MSKLIASSFALLADDLLPSTFESSLDPIRNSGAGGVRWDDLGCDVEGDLPTVAALLSRTSTMLLALVVV